MRVYYGRVSTEQRDQETSIERQMADGKRLGCDLILVDRESGRTDDRPQYQKLLQLIRLGEVTEVIASRGDRLNRNQSEMQYFYNLCLESGVRWTFTDESGASWDSEWGEEFRRQKAYEAELESARLARRQEKAYEHAEREGKAIARKKTLGYRINKQRRYELDKLLPDRSNVIGYLDGKPICEAEIARWLVEFYMSEQSLRQALRQWKIGLDLLDTRKGDRDRVSVLLKFGSSSFQNWLRNPTLRGHTAYGRFKKIRHGEKLDKVKYVEAAEHEWRIVYNTHPEEALISESEWVAIAKILETNHGRGIAIARSRKKPGEPVTLSTILRCCNCRQRFVAVGSTHNNKLYRYYYCGGRKDFSCTGAGIPEKNLVDQILDAIVAKAQELSKLVSSAEKGFVPVADPDQLEVLRRKAEEAERDYEATRIKDFKELAQKLNQRIAQIEASRARLVEQQQNNLTLLMALGDRQYWDSLTQIDLHKDLRSLVRDCWMENGKVVAIDLVL